LNNVLSVLSNEMNAARENLAPAVSSRLPIGILFVVPYIRKNYMEQGRSNLNRHYEVLEAALGPWCETERCHVLWGKYSRDELLEERAYLEWTDGTVGSCPSLDALFCTPL
jgi:hypothetical protein